MGIRYAAVVCGLVLAVGLVGCETVPSGGSAQLRNTVYATHKLTQNLDRNLARSLERLNETSAELVARLESSDVTTRTVLSVAEENQVKLETLQRRLDELTVTLYRHLNLSPPVAVAPVSPGPRASATPSSPPSGVVNVESGNIVVQPPVENLAGETVPAQPPTPAQTVSPEDADSHYRRAQQLYASEEYALARQQFNSYLTLFPNTKYAANAQYWRAHCYFKTGDYEECILEFETLRTNYPTSGKVPIAMHNQAVAYSRLGQNERAKDLFEKLIREYPDDVATEGARVKLRQLQELN